MLSFNFFSDLKSPFCNVYDFKKIDIFDSALKSEPKPQHSPQ